MATLRGTELKLDAIRVIIIVSEDEGIACGWCIPAIRQARESEAHVHKSGRIGATHSCSLLKRRDVREQCVSLFVRGHGYIFVGDGFLLKGRIGEDEGAGRRGSGRPGERHHNKSQNLFRDLICTIPYMYIMVL